MKLKKLISILMILVMMMGVGGCMKEGPEAVKQDLLNYIEKKYGEKFVIVKYGLEDGYANIQFDHIVVHPQKDKEKVFMAYREKKRNGSGYEYHDGYAYRLAEPLMDERIKSIVGNEFSNFKFAANISNGHLEFTSHDYKNGDMDLDEFLKKEEKDSGCAIEIVTTINGNDKPDKNRICEEAYSFTKKLIDNKVVKNKICVNTHFFILNDSDFERVNPKELNRNLVTARILKDKYHVKAEVVTGSDDGLNYNDTIQSMLKYYDDYRGDK